MSVVSAIQALKSKNNAQQQEAAPISKIDVEKIERETEELLERYRKQNNHSEMIASKRDISTLDGNISKLNS